MNNYSEISSFNESSKVERSPKFRFSSKILMGKVKIFILIIFTFLPLIQPLAQIKIKAVGDIMLGSVTPQRVIPGQGGREFAESIKQYLKNADVIFGNLEGTFIDDSLKPQKCSDGARKKKICYEFGMPDSLVISLIEMGFTVLNLDNNHSEDYGIKGYNHTIKLLSNSGIAYAPKRGFASLKYEDKKIAVAAFGYSGNSNSVSDLENDSIIIKNLKRLFDIVIVSFHGGAEGKTEFKVPKEKEKFLGEDRGDVFAFAHAVIDAGADLVIGHGPHVLRGLELYKNKLIAYSLGNFLTYGNVNISGLSGISIILNVTLNNENGNFLRGKLISTVQIGRGIPAHDDLNRGANFIKNYSATDFPNSKIFFSPNFSIYPTNLTEVKYKLVEIISSEVNIPDINPVSVKSLGIY
ncbi:MAG TPA: CapA family protein [Ignavibacteriaceae bacterium]|nr:CapA family protein [Ignavibacteriaceae bacterium]